MARTRRLAGLLGMVVATGAAVAAPASGDEWGDSVSEAVARLDAARRDAGFDDRSWIQSRTDEVQTGAGIARVDATLVVTNRDARGLEWSRVLPVDPAADLIGATYVRPDGVSTRAVSLGVRDVDEWYRRATRPTPGRDPMRIDRPSRDRLVVRIFPVPSGATVKLVLAFATPLRGAGRERVYHDPLEVRVEGEAPAVTASETATTFPASMTLPVAHMPASSVLLRLGGVLPEGGLDGLAPQPTRDGIVVSPPDGKDLPPVSLRALRGAPPAATFAAGGYPLLTDAFAWRADPALLADSLGLESLAGVTLRLGAVSGSSSRIAPEVLRASDEPTMVLGRAYPGTPLKVALEAVGRDGAVLAKKVVAIESVRASFDERMVDALRAYHRGRLSERVYRWAGDDAKRREAAAAYSVDLGVIGADVSAFAVPKDERRFLDAKEVARYLTDGVPFDGDAQDGDYRSAPPGSLK